jgi:hypothetical protein
MGLRCAMFVSIVSAPFRFSMDIFSFIGLRPLVPAAFGSASTLPRFRTGSCPGSNIESSRNLHFRSAFCTAA